MRDLTSDHDDDPEACAGEPVDYDWADDPDAEEVPDGGSDPRPGQAA